jgi:hypothetical protein
VGDAATPRGYDRLDAHILGCAPSQRIYHGISIPLKLTGRYLPAEQSIDAWHWQQMRPPTTHRARQCRKASGLQRYRH